MRQYYAKGPKWQFVGDKNYGEAWMTTDEINACPKGAGYKFYGEVRRWILEAEQHLDEELIALGAFD
jgi:hypothetical protein